MNGFISSLDGMKARVGGANLGFRGEGNARLAPTSISGILNSLSTDSERHTLDEHGFFRHQFRARIRCGVVQREPNLFEV